MTENQVKRRIDELCERLNFLSYKYYVENESPVSDYEYDMLMQRYREIEAEHPEFVTADSISQRVGGKASTKFEPVTHQVPLESLNDVFSYSHKSSPKGFSSSLLYLPNLEITHFTLLPFDNLPEIISSSALRKI